MLLKKLRAPLWISVSSAKTISSPERESVNARKVLPEARKSA